MNPVSHSKLTHLNTAGEAQMVDISSKASTVRTAKASACIHMSKEAFHTIQTGNAPKGDVLATARIAGIMAAKKTADVIPMCHAISLTKVEIDIQPLSSGDGYQIQTTCCTKGQTGVEMEALTAASVTALTLYDMAKALDKTMVISDLKLIFKSGGVSGHFSRHDP